MSSLPTDQAIAEAVATITETTGWHTTCATVRPEGVRMAYRFLSEQSARKSVNYQHISLKHIIEAWAGSYTSTSDVIAAAHILGLKGTYPNFNISSRLYCAEVDDLPEFGRHSNYFDNSWGHQEHKHLFTDQWKAKARSKGGYL